MTRDELLTQFITEIRPGYRPEDVLREISKAGYTLVPIEPTEAITDAIYDAETHNCTSFEVYRAAIKAAENDDG